METSVSKVSRSIDKPLFYNSGWLPSMVRHPENAGSKAFGLQQEIDYVARTHSHHPSRHLSAATYFSSRPSSTIDCYNNQRPHQALDMRYPAEQYVSSTRSYIGLPDLQYPFHDKAVTVTTCGRICFNRRKIKHRLRRPNRRHQTGHR